MTRRELLKKSLLILATTAIPGKVILEKLTAGHQDLWSDITSKPFRWSDSNRNIMQDIQNARKAIHASIGTPSFVILSPERYKEWVEVFGIEPEYLKQPNGMMIDVNLIIDKSQMVE